MIAPVGRLLVVHPMQAWSSACPSEQIAQRWRDPADRPGSHFLELYASGGWKLCYSEPEFILRKVQAAERMAKAGSAPWTKLPS